MGDVGFNSTIYKTSPYYVPVPDGYGVWPGTIHPALYEDRYGFRFWFGQEHSSYVKSARSDAHGFIPNIIEIVGEYGFVFSAQSISDYAYYTKERIRSNLANLHCHPMYSWFTYRRMAQEIHDKYPSLYTLGALGNIPKNHETLNGYRIPDDKLLEVIAECAMVFNTWLFIRQTYASETSLTFALKEVRLEPSENWHLSRMDTTLVDDVPIIRNVAHLWPHPPLFESHIVWLMKRMRSAEVKRQASHTPIVEFTLLELNEMRDFLVAILKPVRNPKFPDEYILQSSGVFTLHDGYKNHPLDWNIGLWETLDSPGGIRQYLLDYIATLFLWFSEAYAKFTDNFTRYYPEYLRDRSIYITVDPYHRLDAISKDVYYMVGRPDRPKPGDDKLNFMQQVYSRFEQGNFSISLDELIRMRDILLFYGIIGIYPNGLHKPPTLWHAQWTELDWDLSAWKTVASPSARQFLADYISSVFYYYCNAYYSYTNEWKTFTGSMLRPIRPSFNPVAFDGFVVDGKLIEDRAQWTKVQAELHSESTKEIVETYGNSTGWYSFRMLEVRDAWMRSYFEGTIGSLVKGINIGILVGALTWFLPLVNAVSTIAPYVGGIISIANAKEIGHWKRLIPEITDDSKVDGKSRLTPQQLYEMKIYNAMLKYPLPQAALPHWWYSFIAATSSIKTDYDRLMIRQWDAYLRWLECFVDYQEKMVELAQNLGRLEGEDLALARKLLQNVAMAGKPVKDADGKPLDNLQGKDLLNQMPDLGCLDPDTEPDSLWNIFLFPGIAIFGTKFKDWVAKFLNKATKKLLDYLNAALAAAIEILKKVVTTVIAALPTLSPYLIAAGVAVVALVYGSQVVKEYAKTPRGISLKRTFDEMNK